MARLEEEKGFQALAQSKKKGAAGAKEQAEGRAGRLPFAVLPLHDCHDRHVEQPPEYGPGIQVRRVRSNGQIKWHGRLMFVSETLIGEPIGLQQLDEDRWRIIFCNMPLGVINDRLASIERLG